MFYALLKIYARLAIKIYCPEIRINRPDGLKVKGPLLLAANHPNSFLDGIILTTLFREPVYSLARGDAFGNHRVSRLLRRLKLLPVYRRSEGAQNLGHNYATFDACLETFRKGGIVLIFSEGWCENEWHLRPLKKGTARLSFMTWEQQIPLRVLPVAFNYSSFRNFGKRLHLYFGDPIGQHDFDERDPGGKRLLAFNAALSKELRPHVYEIGPKDRSALKKRFGIRIRPWFFILLLPAVIGWAVHAPLFYLIKILTLSFRKSDHYDSVLVAALMLLYPVYLLALFIGLLLSMPWYALLVLAMPLLARAAVQCKLQLKG